MRFASLASGSRGNCLVAEAGTTRVLVDCGLTARETERRLARRGLMPRDLTGILLTHEHEDHVGGAFSFAQQHALTVYLTHGTLQAVREAGRVGSTATRIIDGRGGFDLDGLHVRPFTVPHDAREPVQYVLSDGAFNLAVLTDLGASTSHVEQMLSGCDALVLECNHDLDMLRAGNYPQRLKERIAGPFGHLDNGASARLLGAIDRSRLKHVIGAHLSEKNNRPELVREALARALGCNPEGVSVASQEDGFDWRELR